MKTLVTLIAMMLMSSVTYADTSKDPRIEKIIVASATVTKLDVIP